MGISGGSPLNQTLDGRLLAAFSSGDSHFDALHLQLLPTAAELAAGNCSVSYTLLLNQSAIAGLPAAMAQANTALLRMALSGGGAGGGAAEVGSGSGSSSRDGSSSKLSDSSRRRLLRGGELGEQPVAEERPTIRVFTKAFPLQVCWSTALIGLFWDQTNTH
jgi:hypothetical protein